MKKALRNFINFFFFRLLPPVLSFYDTHIFYRLRQAYGRAMLRGIKHKGNNVKIHGRCTIIIKDKFEIEDDVRIGNNCYFFAMGGIKICRNAQLSRNVVVYSANHSYDGEAIPYDDTYKLQQVVIGASSWIGMNTCILPGVTIGKGAVVGMGSVVTKNVPDGAIVAGVPATLIRHRDMEHFNLLDMQQKHFGKLYKDA